jgi:hypothetical protein
MECKNPIICPTISLPYPHVVVDAAIDWRDQSSDRVRSVQLSRVADQQSIEKNVEICSNIVIYVNPFIYKANPSPSQRMPARRKRRSPYELMRSWAGRSMHWSRTL